MRVWDVLFTEGGTRSVFQLRVALALLKIFEPILLKKNSFEGIMEVFKIVLQSMWNSQSVRLHSQHFRSNQVGILTLLQASGGRHFS